MTDSSGQIHVTVRDGRTGRVGGLAGVDGTGAGQILVDLERATPFDLEDELELPDGVAVVVIGVDQDIEHGVRWHQTVSVGTKLNL